MTTAIEQTLETYGIENWGAGYFDVNRKGNLIVRPAEGDTRSADLREIVEDLARRGIGAPVLLRFPQLVAAQVRKLQRAFSRSIREFEYQGAHMCVYPMKVNQQRSLVEEYLREGSRYDLVSRPVPRLSSTQLLPWNKHPTACWCSMVSRTKSLSKWLLPARGQANAWSSSSKS